MFLKDSRYASCRRYAADARGVVRCKGTRPRPLGAALGVIEHVVAEGDRLDLLAHHYYGDARLWWRILEANPDLASGVDISRAALGARVGEVVLIPKAKE